MGASWGWVGRWVPAAWISAAWISSSSPKPPSTPGKPYFLLVKSPKRRLEDAQGASEGKKYDSGFRKLPSNRPTGYTSPFLRRRGQSVESLPKALGGRLEGLKQVEKLVHGYSGAANQRPQGAQREFLVLGNREVDPYARLDQHEMAADLTDGFPSGALEGSGRLLPGNVPQSPHALDGHHDRWDSFTVRQSGDGFLVFGP